MFLIVLAVRPELVGNDGPNWGMNHCGVVDRWKVPINQVKLIFSQQHRPNGFDLDVSKVLTNAAMPTCKTLSYKKVILPAKYSKRIYGGAACSTGYFLSGQATGHPIWQSFNQTMHEKLAAIFDCLPEFAEYLTSSLRLADEVICNK